MPDRIITFLDSIFMTIVTASVLLASMNLITVIAGLLSVLWWIGKLKRDVQKFHNNSLWRYIKWLIKINR